MKGKRIEKINAKRKDTKRKISIFTVMLWLFLVTTLITITVNSTKKTNALEVEDKNWNISLVMYDRGSDTPNEAITEFTWNATDEIERKQLCMQINYACTTGKEYQPGEIEITIPGISKDSFSEYYRNISPYDGAVPTIAADKVSDVVKEHDFSYSYDEKNNIYTFINNKIINENEHFEGSIQIVYNLRTIFRIKTDLEYVAKIRENIENSEEIISMESNTCKFHYTSIKKTYTLGNNVEVAPKGNYTKIENILNDYYWVKYIFRASDQSNGVIDAYGRGRHLVTYVSGSECIKETLPNGCVLYNERLNKVNPIKENTYYLSTEGTPVTSYYYVGYPKSIYKEGDSITNTAELWGRYEDEKESQKLDEKTTTIKLADFNFEYTGELYRISKSSYSDGLYLNRIKEEGQSEIFGLSATAFHSGNKIDVEIGDDLLYITRKNGDISKLNDDEYNFTKLKIPIFCTYSESSGGSGNVLEGYNYEIQVRYKNENEYVVYKEGQTKKTSEDIKFDRNDIVGVKVVIKDLDKTLYNAMIEVTLNIHTDDCNKGSLYNFDYIQAYIKDENGNRTLHNKVELDNYTTDMTKLEIAEYDIVTYGRYIQRSCKSIGIREGYFELDVGKGGEIKNNNVKEEKYEAVYMLSAFFKINSFKVDRDCIVKQYDILPSGINLASSKDEIINSIESNLPYKNLKLKDGTVFNTNRDLENYIKENAEVEIDYNYKDSGRTKISIIYNLNGIDWSYYLTNWAFSWTINIKLRTEIPYNSILEYGTSYTNYTYLMWNNYEYSYGSNPYKDNGKWDPLASDIDNDGDTQESVIYSRNTLSITHAVSSQQAVIKQVRTDMTKGKFVSDIAEATAGSEYTYKLKVSTGANSLKDLIIYDNLEIILDSDGNDISEGWKGDFLGVDTTYAKSKGYAPVVYYSEELNPGKLTEVSEKWKELTEDTDKTNVKSICVDLRYKADGTEMELNNNDLIYVLINMQTPNDRTLITSANNMFSTNWRAKDSHGNTIDNIEGIYSNQVSVNIFKEENRKQDIAGKKEWEDSDNYYKLRPESITVKLLQDGVEYETKIVTKSDDWEYVFKDVPVYKNKDLEKYTYEIKEENIPYYETEYYGYNIINTLIKKDISGKKEWEDSYNKYNSRPKSITVKLLQDGVEYKRMEVTEENNWEYTFESVPIYKNENKEEYEYTIEEVEIPTYNIKYNIYNYNITNTLKTKNIEVSKIWDDSENEKGLRPKFILIKLFDGENLLREEYIRKENNWKCKFYGLPEYRADGSKIEYTVDEEVEEYREEYLGGGNWDYESNFDSEDGFDLYNEHYIKQINGTTITNKYVEPNEIIKITGTKVWEDENNKVGKRPESIVLQIKNGDKVVSEGVVTEENNWSYEFEVPKYDEEGNEIEYHIDEKETPKFYEKELTDKLTVTNKFKVPDEKVKVQVIKLWEDMEDKYSKRPNSIVLQVYDGDKLIAEQKVSKKSNWSYEFKLPKYDELGNEIEYRVDEKDVPKYYEKRVSGYTVINKCTYEPDVDTSDINIFVYVAIFFVAVIGIFVGVILVRKKKKI